MFISLCGRTIEYERVAVDYVYFGSPSLCILKFNMRPQGTTEHEKCVGQGSV